MPLRAFKYLSPFLIYFGAFVSFTHTGFVVWLPLLYAFGFIPFIELFLRPREQNMSQAKEEIAKKNKWYDAVLYLVVPAQYAALFVFLNAVSFQPQTTVDLVGKTLVMGLLCGVFGINVAHELGHRVKKSEQFLAKALLLTSLYMHFFIEHNKGHHKRVATPEDPASARLGETLYGFYARSIFFSYLSAWRIAARDQRKKNRKVMGFSNEMLQMQLIQIFLLFTIFLFFGIQTLLWFLVAAIMGILLLETVNYIEHYGLQRRPVAEGKYERALPQHSWNSNHVIGRVMLFELSRHSDHHYLASRKYQVLRHHEGSPQMPTGYPGMMLLSMVPPLWFTLMNKKASLVNNGR